MKKRILGAFLAIAIIFPAPASAFWGAWLDLSQPVPLERSFIERVSAAIVSGAIIAYINYKWLYQPKTVQKPQEKKVAILSLNDDTSLSDFAAQLFVLAKNPECAGVLLKIDCYGGAVVDFRVAHDLVKKVSAKKPVVAIIMGGACSCGYLIASAARYIIAHSGSAVGNIGVTLSISQYADKKLDRNGITCDVATEMFIGGKYKGIGDPDKPLTDADREYLQQRIEVIYQEFIKTVASNRALNVVQSGDWAEGKIFTPGQAIDLKLIDAIGTQFEAEEKMCELLGVASDAVIFAAA